MYKIFQGVIKSIDNTRRDNNITTYTIHNVRDSIGNQMSNKIFYNIAHGYTSDPDNNETIYTEGTLVYFVSDDMSMSEGAIIAAIQHNPGGRLPIKNKSIIGEDFSDLFQTTEPYITKKDIVFRKLQGLILLAYTGLLKLRSKLGLEILMNPVINKMTVLAKKLKIQFHGVENNTIEFGFQDERKGLANINLAFNTDVSGTDLEASLINIKLGSHKEPDVRATISITDINSTILKQQIKILKDGSTDVILRNLTMDINGESTVTFDDTGKAYIKTKEFYLGQGTTDQPFIRGTEFKNNYDGLLDLIKNHKHLVIQGRALPSESLQILPAKKLQDGQELSSTNKLD